MSDYFYTFLSHWYSHEYENAQDYRHFPDYFRTEEACTRIALALEDMLTGDARRTFMEYESASSDLSLLLEKAAFLTGLRAGLRLCLRLR